MKLGITSSHHIGYVDITHLAVGGVVDELAVLLDPLTIAQGGFAAEGFYRNNSRGEGRFRIGLVFGLNGQCDFVGSQVNQGGSRWEGFTQALAVDRQ